MIRAPAAAGAAANAVPLGAGEQLRRARQSQNIPLSEVSRRLRLKPEVVSALEGECCEGLAPAYVRGYLRSYARIVGLDPEVILSACRTLKEHDVPVVPRRSSGEVQGLGDANRSLRFGTYAVVTVLGLLLAASWRAQYSSPPDKSVEPTEQGEAQGPAEASRPPEVTASSGLHYGYPIVHHPEQLPEPMDASPHAAVPEEGVPSLSQPSLGAAEPVREPEPADIPRAPDGRGHRLVLELGDNSWAEVRDAYGAKLYYNLATKGQTITLEGLPPFSVVLGNSAGVTVFYNGRPVDLRPWSQHGEVARFRVGDEVVDR